MSTPRRVKGVNSKYRAMRRAQAHRAYWRHQNKYYLEQELEEERLEPPAQRAIAELDRTLANDLSWTTSFPGLVDIRAATLREVWDKMDSFSQELHQAVWDVLQNLVRATTRRWKFLSIREDAEEFGEFFHEGKASAPPKVRSFEEDALLKRPPPDYEQSQEHWLDLHDGTREKLWRLYRMDNPSTLEDDEESVRMEEAMARARKERSDKKAREDREREYAVKRVDLQTQLDEAARQLWSDERTRQGAEDRIADEEAQIKELKAEAAAASSHQRETYDRYQKLLQEWRSEERKSSGTSLQDLVLEPLRLPDLPPSVRLFEKRAEPQRSAAPPPDNAEAARPVPAWVGSPSRRPTPEARRTPPTRGVLAKFVDHSRALGRKGRPQPEGARV